MVLLVFEDKTVINVDNIFGLTTPCFKNKCGLFVKNGEWRTLNVPTRNREKAAEEEEIRDRIM